MGKKIVKWSLISLLGVIVIFLSIVLINHYTYKVKGVSERIENNTGLIQAKGRGLYDANGDEVIFRGVNLGGWFVSEGWLEPYCITEVKHDYVDGELRPIYETVNWEGTTLTDKFSQDEMLRALKNNTNLTDEQRKNVLNEFYKNWITEEDIEDIASMGFNQVRIPFGWRMILNDDYSVRTDLDESLYYLTECIRWCKTNNIYVVLDLHSCPMSQNGYEHGGAIEWIESTPGKKCAHLWENEDAIEATILIWETLSDKYNTNEFKNTICMYDIMNEPRNTTGVTDKVTWDVFDRIYDAIREKNDNHVIIMEGMWTYACLPDPKTYGWENVCYSYHWYNFSPLNKTDFEFELYYAYQDMFNIGKDYDVPVYIGEFSLFETGSDDDKVEKTTSRWTKCLNMWENRHYSWCVWTYKKAVNGWWGDTWGLYNLNAASEYGGEYKDRVNLGAATYNEIIDAFSLANIGSDVCKKSIMYDILKKYNLNK